MSFEIGKSYNFSTIAPTTLGAIFSNMKVVSILDFNIAIKFSDIVSIRSKVLQETTNNLLPMRDISYIMFENEYKDTVVLAEDWVVPSSIVAIDNININIAIKNITTEDKILINNTLTALGFKPVIETIVI